MDLAVTAVALHCKRQRTTSHTRTAALEAMVEDVSVVEV